MLEFLAYHPFAMTLIIVGSIIFGFVWVRDLDYYLYHWREIDDKERNKK